MLAVTAVLTSSGCSSEPELRFADWLIDVPEGTPVLEYAPVPLEGRDPNAVRMVEDLVIGATPTGEEAILFEPGSIVATTAGNVLVTDNGTHNVKIFGPDGGFIRSFGNQGQGPGEFGRFGGMVIAGDSLVIYDSGNRRFSLWTLHGEHVADHALAAGLTLTELYGLADGTLAALSRTFGDDARIERGVVHMTVEGEELSRPFESPFPSFAIAMDISNPVEMLQNIVDTLDNPRARVGVAAGETILVTPASEYQILALAPDGAARWALRVAWERTPWPDAERAAFVDSVVGGLPIEDKPTAADAIWPELSPPLSALHSDGAGRIYVWLTPRLGRYPAPDDRYPVDVYSPDGEFLAAGVVHQRWSYGAGEYLYGLRPDAFDEIEVVRYRIEVNR